MRKSKPLVDLYYVAGIAQQLAAGVTTEIDVVSGFRHDRSTHAKLVEGSSLAWWLLGARDQSTTWELLLPDRDSALFRYWVRAGLTAVASSQNLPIRSQGGDSVDHFNETQLPNIDWDIFDYSDGVDTGHIRLIRDLETSQRMVPTPSSSGLRYSWLRSLNLLSPALSPNGYQRFLRDADTVMAELIDNVHRWSKADSAFAVVSVTRGGGARSWNRLHIVVADNGIGIPCALRSDLRALAAVHRASNLNDYDLLSDERILQTLIFKAFGSRDLPNHNGHGLNATHIRAGQWVGAFDIVTVDGEGSVVRAGTRGLSPDQVETGPAPTMPGASGTLVHVMMQAVESKDLRKEAAYDEALPFEIHGCDEAARHLYEPFSVPA